MATSINKKYTPNNYVKRSVKTRRRRIAGNRPNLYQDNRKQTKLGHNTMKILTTCSNISSSNDTRMSRVEMTI